MLIINFITMTAWTGLVLSILWIICAKVYAWSYSGSDEQICDMIMFGHIATFPIGKPLVILILSALWLGAYYFTAW